MLGALLVLLSCQLVGEAAVRALGISVPGPVLGMAFLVAGFAMIPKLAAMMRPLAQGVLGYLSLLFVPAGVGVVGHLDRLGGAQGVAILVAVVVSTVLAMAVGAVVFTLVARATGTQDE